ncbi:hypothetical protein [Curvibacter gracilis]|uniref:hypothetical protein n=1 Tax=Curvibacter gracilis TaxID=230310 RepID=UPI0012FA2A9E|nr:hypothetical protein [Curvibacter gracilis]
MKNPENSSSEMKSCMSQCGIFESEFDIREMPYDEIMRILKDYISEKIIMSKNEMWKFSPSALRIVRFYIEKVDNYLLGNISDEELNIYCNENFGNMEDSGISLNDFNIYKIIHYILFNRNRSSVAMDGADYLIGFFFMDVGRFGAGACEQFRIYIEGHSIMSNYRIKY